jgi:hypothetical protein
LIQPRNTAFPSNMFTNLARRRCGQQRSQCDAVRKSQGGENLERFTEHGWGGIQDVRFPERVGTRDCRPWRWCGSSCGCCDIPGDRRAGERARGPRAGGVRRKQPGGRDGQPGVEGADRLSASTWPESPRGVCEHMPLERVVVAFAAAHSRRVSRWSSAASSLPRPDEKMCIIHGSLPRPDEKMCIRPQVMKVLKSMVGSIDLRAPMRVIKYATFEEHGCIPRSNDEKTVLLSELPADNKVRRLFFPLDLLLHTRWPCPPLLVARFPGGIPRLLISARGCWRGAGCVHLAPMASAVVHQEGVRGE